MQLGCHAGLPARHNDGAQRTEVGIDAKVHITSLSDIVVGGKRRRADNHRVNEVVLQDAEHPLSGLKHGLGFARYCARSILGKQVHHGVRLLARRRV